MAPDAAGRAVTVVVLPCPLVCRGRAVAVEHLTAAPTGQPHKVALLAASSKPLVGEAVAELVGVDTWQSRRRRPLGDHLAEGTDAERSVLAEPEFLAVGVAVRLAETEIATAVFAPKRTARVCPPLPVTYARRSFSSTSASFSAASSPRRM